MVRHEYHCPRCDHKTVHRNDMKKHFERKKICANERGVELTDEIKNVVLTEHRYHPPVKDTRNIVINNNTLNKFILKMDFNEKMKHILEYKNKKLVCFEDTIENQFENRVNRLEMDKYPNGYFLEQNDFFKIVNSVTRIRKENIEDFGIFYRKTIRRLELYSGTTWEMFIDEDGALEVIRLIKSYFLDHYEQYIIKQLFKSDGEESEQIGIDHPKLLEYLKIYYRFISIFELRPFVSDCTDKDLIGKELSEQTNHVLAEKYMGLYSDEKGNLKACEKNQTKKKIINIIKDNTSQNVTELDALVVEILRADDLFKQRVLDEMG